MRKNLGSTDKIIRLLAAAAIILLYFTNVISGTLGTILLIVAGLFIVTSLINFCPLYRLLGISSLKK